jgi:ficolin
VKNILKPIESCRNAPKSGDYDMYFAKSDTSLPVYCDQETDGGGWLVIQRRKDGSVDFERTWADYKTGFGDIENEFWIGNDNLHALTSSGLNELRIDMQDFQGNKAYAKYRNFKVHPENELYKSEVGDYSGDAGDSLAVYNRMAFSTKDRDNDKCDGVSCSEYRRGAWWYHYYCGFSNLNGHYYHDGNSPYDKGIYWYQWKGWSYSLKTVEMKIR